MNTLSDSEFVARTGLLPTRSNNQLHQIYVSDQQHTGVKVVKSAVESDHLAMVDGGVVPSVGEMRRVSKHAAALHALILASVSEP